MLCSILTYNIHGLPWSRNNSNPICEWITTTLKPSILCLQEVFLESTRAFLKERLQRYGYTVIIPNDQNICLLSSGLFVAFQESEYSLISTCFCSFQTYHNVEWLANKGFQSMTLLQKKTNRHLQILNTHTQSNTELSWWFGTKFITTIQKKQFQQMIEYIGKSKIPTFIVGDMNCEYSPHPYVHFLRPLRNDKIPSDTIARKSTFYTTGEDLDHVAWIPTQWAENKCGYCDIEQHGPRIEACTIFQKPWSDHAPMFVTIRVPQQNHKPLQEDES